MSQQALMTVDKVMKTFAETRLRGLWGGSAPVKALDDVSLVMERNETLALVGESGSGKSTLARVIVRLVTPDTGRVLLDGDDLLKFDRRGMKGVRQRVQMVFQDPYSSLNPRLRVARAIVEPALVHGLVNADGAPTLAAELLDRVGLTKALGDRLPRELSGGQRQRVAIARALSLSPQVLIADEAVSALDVSIQAQILNLFEELRSELGISILFIAHQLPVVAHIADRIAVMYLGRVVELGTMADVFAMPLHPYTASLIDAQPTRAKRERSPTPQVPSETPVAELQRIGCSYRDRCPLVSDICQAERPLMREHAPGRWSACHHASEVSRPEHAESLASLDADPFAEGGA